jgi:hypothetical protein
MSEEGISLKDYFETVIKDLRCDLTRAITDLKIYHDKDVDDLRHHRDEMTKNLREFLEQQLEAIDRNTRDKAAVMDKRLEGMNELRGAMKDQALLYAEKKDLYAVKESLEKDVRMLRESKAELHGKSSQTAIIVAVIFSILSIILSAVGVFIKLDLTK